MEVMLFRNMNIFQYLGKSRNKNVTLKSVVAINAATLLRLKNDFN